MKSVLWLLILCASAERRSHSDDMQLSGDTDVMQPVEADELNESQTIPQDEEVDPVAEEDVSASPMPSHALDGSGECCGYVHPFPTTTEVPLSPEATIGPSYSEPPETSETSDFPPTVSETKGSESPQPLWSLSPTQGASNSAQPLSGSVQPLQPPSVSPFDISFTSTASESHSFTSSPTLSLSASVSLTASPSPSVSLSSSPSPTSVPDPTSCEAISEKIRGLMDTTNLQNWIDTFRNGAQLLSQCPITESIARVCESTIFLFKQQTSLSVPMAVELKAVYQSSFVVGSSSFALHLCLAELGDVLVDIVHSQPQNSHMDVFLQSVSTYAVIMIQRMKLIPDAAGALPDAYSAALTSLNSINQQISDVIDLIGILSNQDVGAQKVLSPIANLHESMLRLVVKCTVPDLTSTLATPLSSASNSPSPEPSIPSRFENENNLIKSNNVHSPETYSFDERPTRWRVCAGTAGMVMLLAAAVLVLLAAVSSPFKPSDTH